MEEKTKQVLCILGLFCLLVIVHRDMERICVDRSLSPYHSPTCVTLQALAAATELCWLDVQLAARQFLGVRALSAEAPRKQSGSAPVRKVVGYKT